MSGPGLLRSLLARWWHGRNRLSGHRLGGVGTSSYIRKWLPVSVLIGAVAGTGALAFYHVLHLATELLLGWAGGYHPPMAVGEGGAAGGSGDHGFSRPWAIPLVTAAGGLLSGLLVYFFAPEAEGHGTDAAIHAAHADPKAMRARTTIVKMLASSITIGSGGSGGREGPTAQISASFGSILARRLNLTPTDARIAVSAGLAAGIAAIFRAPLGGALLGVELLFLADMQIAALMPALIASIVAYAIFGAAEGFTPVFGNLTEYHFDDPLQLGYFALLGLAAGLVGRLYVRGFYGMSALWRRVRLPRYVKPAVAGLVVGALGLAVPGVLGTGYGTVQHELSRHVLLGMPLWIVLLIPFAKIFATSMSIGSGGSGGIFGPGMVIGGATGAALWRLLEPVLPAVPHSPVPFVIVGMIACFGSVAHTPIAVMLMVAEMTGNLWMLAPAMVAMALAALVVGDTTIYRSQRRNRAETLAQRLHSNLPEPSALAVSEVMVAPRLLIEADSLATLALTRLRKAQLASAPVVDGSGAFVGTVRQHVLDGQSLDGARAGRVVDAQAATLTPDTTLEDAVDVLAVGGAGRVPVVDSGSRVVGELDTADLMRGYRHSLRRSLRRLAGAGSTPR